MPRPALFPLFLASALLAIASGTGWIDLPGLYWLAKPLTTLLVIAFAWGRGQAQPALRRAVLVGLGLSLLGDVALMFPQGFLAGLVAFLLAHLAYLVAFTRGGVRFMARRAPFGAYALLAAVILAILWPGVPAGLRAPVVAYVLCLAAMAAQAAARWQVQRDSLSRHAALGGLLFMSSDALLAINRFHSPLPASALWVLASYWAAQWLIASALPRR